MQEPNLVPFYVVATIGVVLYFGYQLWMTKNVLWSCFGTIGYICLLATAFLLPWNDVITILFGVGATFIVSSILLALGLYFFERNEKKGEAS